jgi:hypothetical protein
MRRLVDADRLRRLMRALGKEARSEARVYLTGGASAVLLGWRGSTIDVDLKIEPEQDEVLRAIPELKDRLEVNVELASPGDFMPELPGWRDRSPFITREGNLAFHHYDFYGQALSKLERRHVRDVDDVLQMHARRLIDPTRLLELFAAIESQLYRYPAIDPRSFRNVVKETAARLAGQGG